MTLNFHDEHPFELFAQIGKAGSDISAFTEAIARLISLAFRCGIEPEAVADELMGIGGSRFIGFGPNRVRSVPDAIGLFLNEYLNKIKENEAPYGAHRQGYWPAKSQLELGLVPTATAAAVDQEKPAPDPKQNARAARARSGIISVRCAECIPLATSKAAPNASPAATQSADQITDYRINELTRFLRRKT